MFLVRFFALLLLPFLFFYAWATLRLIVGIDIYTAKNAFFLSGIAVGGVLSFVFFAGGGLLPTLLHELTHAFWAILSFRRPVSLKVKSGKGEFKFKGSKNMMIVLSPYFFPLLPLIALPFCIIFATGLGNWSYAILGATMGFGFVIQLRQAHRGQTDIKHYGAFFSYPIIVFFQVLFWGILLAYVTDNLSGVKHFLVGGFNQTIDYIIELFRAITK